MSSLSAPEPVILVDLFPAILDGLLDLLRGLSAEEWDRPTACEDWSVKDVALHMLGGEIGNLSRRRDGHAVPATIATWAELVAYINGWNVDWVQATRRISPQLLIDLLQFTGTQMADYFRSLDLYAPGAPVSWAGPEPAPVWLDVAREYTERWHHQQHIRDAVSKPGFLEPRYLAPVLATFVWALPRTLALTEAPERTAVTLTITGSAGSRWSTVREQGGWKLYAGAPDRTDAEVVVDEDTAWRLFTRGLDPAQAGQRAALRGDLALARRTLEAVSIIA
jgi:uncharacterized protein (TIGR03083 family)